ncbi:BRO family protein [Kitasatospora sp. NPDC048545]|uniref:BRO family protein n=1 Tax=Kitasatospora sp. NPDC048545 TaxID=3157208 RepID=UPI0033F20AF4
MVLVRSSFPVTGQPIRVVMIDGEPWFVTTDVCRILGRGNAAQAVTGLEDHRHRTVDMRSVTVTKSDSHDVSQVGNCVERVGIRGGTAVPRCSKVKIVDLVRMLVVAPAPVPVGDGPLTVELHGARILGTARQISDLMREYGR